MTTVRCPILFSIALLTSGFMMAGMASAQETAAKPASVLFLELNAAQPSDKGCRLTFVVNNGLATDLTKASFEIALFNESGVVDRMTVLDFKELPQGKTKVSRFDLAGIDCGKISRALVNGSNDCAGDGIEPTACMKALQPGSKTDIEFGV